MSVAYRSTCRPTHGRYIDRGVSVNIASDISVDTSADMSVDTSTDTSRSTHRPRVGRYVDRHIGRGVRKLHMIRFQIIILLNDYLYFPYSSSSSLYIEGDLLQMLFCYFDAYVRSGCVCLHL